MTMSIIIYHHHHHYHCDHGHLCKADGAAVVSVQRHGQLVIVPQGVCRALRLKYLLFFVPFSDLPRNE